MKIREKVVLITGASSGIGEEAAKIAASKGALTVCIARDEKQLMRVAGEIREKTGNDILIIPSDITIASSRHRIFEIIQSTYGRLDILINNVGITAHGRFDESDMSIMRSVMEVNFFAMAELTFDLLPLMKVDERKKMIHFVSTPSGLYGIPGRFAYSASKAAGNALMETLRLELKRFNIKTSIICPGYTKTGLRSGGLASDGSALNVEQARGAKSPGMVAEEIIRCIEKEKRVTFTDFNGRAVYWLRTLFPSLLEYFIAKKLKNDF